MYSKSINHIPIKLLLILKAALLFISTESKGETSLVSLSVDSGGSLSGTHCPGTVRLVCNGVCLTELSWTYNENLAIYSPGFLADTPVTNITLDKPGFETVELNRVSQVNNSSFANFTSTLTVNLLGLHEEGVFEIVCGDLSFQANLPVDVNIDMSDPPRPNITRVRAIYQNGSLDSLQVSWTKVAVMCPLTISYAVKINDNTVMTLPHTDCEEQCLATISVLEGGSLKILTSNNVTGNVFTTTYPKRISSHNRNLIYINSSLLSDGYTFTCTVFDQSIEMCQVQYSTNPLLLDSVNNTIVANSTLALSDLVYCVPYYIEFSVELGNQIEIVERLEFIRYSEALPGIGEWALLGLNIIISILVFSVILILIWKTAIDKKDKVSALIGLAIIFAVFFTFFFSWVGVLLSGVCRGNWMVIRITLLVVSLLCLILGFGAVTLFMCFKCYKKAVTGTIAETSDSREKYAQAGDFEEKMQDTSTVHPVTEYTETIMMEIHRCIVQEEPVAEIEQFNPFPSLRECKIPTT